MKTRRFARSLLAFLAALAALAAFAALDWYPTVKDLGRLRRERGELMHRIQGHRSAATRIALPDREEEALFGATMIDLRQALLNVADDDAWTAITILETQNRAKEDGIPYARFMFNWFLWGTDLVKMGPERPDSLTEWLGNQQISGIRDSYMLTIGPNRFPWHGILGDLKFSPGLWLASRHVAVALEAPLPALLKFINHVSWGDARLEIVRLHLEPGVPFYRAWLICRGVYVARSTSFAVPPAAGPAEAGLLIDPDSPLLLQRVDRLLVPRVEKKELPPAPSERGDAAPSERGGTAAGPW
jgi:hypothetical protein